MQKKSFVFTVQGEGRGHLTQALTVYEMLVSRGHEIKAILVGSSNRREVPEFVKQKVSCPIITFPSPNFVTDKNNKSIQLGKTIRKNTLQFRKFRQSFRMIKQLMHEYNPDVLINFYEPLGAWWARWHKNNTKVLAIAHQYIYLHSLFKFPAGHSFDEYVIRNYTRFLAAGADKIIALSFYPLSSSGKKLIVTPPILRKEVFDISTSKEDYLLVYLVNAGYMQDIVQWHEKNPETKLHCFTDSKAVKGKWRVDETLCFHSLDDVKFMMYMSGAKGLVTTAGFESVCEAMSLGKPVLMVPVKGHFEQYCNARDAYKAGAGIYDSKFNISALLDHIIHFKPKNNFRDWAKNACSEFYEILDSVSDSKMKDKRKGVTSVVLPRLHKSVK